MEEAETVAVSLSDDGTVDWIHASPSSAQEQTCDTTTVAEDADGDYSGDEEEVDDQFHEEGEEDMAVMGHQRPTVRLVNVRADQRHTDDDENGADGMENIYDGDSCDFCDMETASELCRGEECKQLLGTNFPMYCASCSQTFHRRYPNHRRFVDSSSQNVTSRTLPIRKQEDQSEGLRHSPGSSAISHPYSRHPLPQRGTDDGRRKSARKSFVPTESGARNSTFRFGSGIGLAHAQRLVAANSKKNSSPSQVHRKDTLQLSARWSSGRQSDISLKDETFEYKSPSVKNVIRSNNLQPIHDRYEVLLKHMKANPGQSLQEAYKATGMARSTVLGTRCVAELQLVDPNLFAETLEKAGAKVKVAVLNRMCQEVLSRPDLEVVVAEMRLNTDLLPFSSQLSRQLQFCMEANRTGVNPYA